MRTPLYDQHLQRNARMAPFGGWDMPIQYEGILIEHEHTRRRASVFDTCHMGTVEVRGPRAAADLERLLTLDVAGLRIGQCRYGYLLRADGGVLDDLTCYRKAEDHFWVIVNAGTREGDVAWMRRHLSPGTQLTDLSPVTAKLDIQGPTSREDMEAAFAARLPELGYFTFAETRLLDTPVTISRTGYTGEWGYEIYFPAAEAVRFWTALTAPGAVKPAGLGCRDTLRLEVAYPLYGHELDETRTPVAATRGQFIRRTKDFIGKAAVERDLAQGCPRYLAGLALTGKRAARAHDAVERGGGVIGEITSGSLAPSLGQAVAFAYLDAAACEVGTEVEIAVHGGKKLPARVVALPFYGGGTARRKA